MTDAELLEHIDRSIRLREEHAMPIEDHTPVLSLVMKGRDLHGVRGTIVNRSQSHNRNVVIFTYAQSLRIREAINAESSSS